MSCYKRIDAGFLMLDTGYSGLLQIVTSTNIQYPDARIQDQLMLATDCIMANRVKGNILCNNGVNMASGR